jgi:PST family polysaccharide transporter
LAQGGSFVLTTISTVVLARLLTPQDFGLVAMIAPVLTFMGFFRDLGLSTATVQQAEINHAQVSTLFWVNVVLSAGLMLVSVALAPLAGIFYRRPEVVWLMVAYGLNCFLTGLSIQHTALLRRRLAFGMLASVNLASCAIGIVVGIVAALRGFGFWALAIMSLSTSLASLIAVWWLCSWRPGRPVRGSGVRPMLWFGGFLTGGNLAYFLASNLDTLGIGRWLGAVPLGNYNRGNQVFLVSLQQLSSPLAAVAVPALSRLQGLPERYRAAFLQSVQALALGTIPLACALIAGGDAVTLLVLGDKWGEAAKLVRILAISGVLMPVSGAVSWLLITQGRGKTLMHWNLASVFITLAAVVIGLQWGLMGVAVAMAVKYSLSFFIFTIIACAKGPVAARNVFSAIRVPSVAAISGLAAGLLSREVAFHLEPRAAGWLAVAVFLVVCLGLLLGVRSHRAVVNETLTLARSLLNSRNPSAPGANVAERPIGI